MVNYFTLPKVLEMLQEFTIQFLGTARFCPGWPVQNIKDFDNIQINFNKIFWSVDSFVALIIRWMENGLVLLFTAVLTVMYVSKYLRRRPRVNQKNNIHVDKVWVK